MSAEEGSPIRRIAVYLGSRDGLRASYADAAVTLGRTLAARGLGLVYGGGHVGLMGRVADAVSHGGGTVCGVITEHLADRELAHRGIDELVVVADMAARKKEMFERSDAFVVLPGGVGTLEELFEVWCWASLRLHVKPFGLLNVGGYYDSLLAFMDHAAAEGMLNAAALEHLIVDDDVTALLDRVCQAPGIAASNHA
jgi:uncharacterized protein (TIGR00730 family)